MGKVWIVRDYLGADDVRIWLLESVDDFIHKVPYKIMSCV